MKLFPTEPPALPRDPDLFWVVDGAFARELLGAPGNSARALDLMRALQISGRIAERLGREGCVRCFGNGGSDLFEDHLRNLAVESALQRTLERALHVAAEHGCRVIGLKYAALYAGGYVRPGSRVVQDLDLLVSEHRAYDLWLALQRSGLRRIGASRHEHQLEALADESDTVVEIHVHVPEVRVGGRFARADDLFERSLVMQRPIGSEALWIANPAFLSAHALAHGLLQNRSAPQAYSPLRMLGDLLDLRRHAPGALDAASEFLGEPLDPPLVRGVERLCAELERGLSNGPPPNGSEAMLLRHCLAARLDERYADALRRSFFSSTVSERALPVALLTRAIAAILPGEAELDALYGPARGRLARIARRLRRPVDLARRTFKR